MADREYSKFQQKVIRNYYDNREQIDSTKLSELVTNLYLAETEKKKTKLWENAQKLMERLGGSAEPRRSRGQQRRSRDPGGSCSGFTEGRDWPRQGQAACEEAREVSSSVRPDPVGGCHALA